MQRTTKHSGALINSVGQKFRKGIVRTACLYFITSETSAEKTLSLEWLDG